MPKRRSKTPRKAELPSKHLFTPPYGHGRTDGPPSAEAGRKPLIDLPASVAGQWTWADHALERLEQRGIGVFEVLSALYAPDWSTPRGEGGTHKVIRGDIQVAYEPTTRKIVTVIDRLEDNRTKPREPLHPPVVRQDTPRPPAWMSPETAEKMAQIAAATVAPQQKPEEVRNAEKDDVMTTTTATQNGSNLHDSKPFAREVIQTWISREFEAGQEFSVRQMLDALTDDDYTAGTLRQALNQLRGKTIRSMSEAGKRTGRYRVLQTARVARDDVPAFVSDAMHREAVASVALDGETQSVEPPAPVDAPVVDVLVGQTGAREGRAVAVFELEEPPPGKRQWAEADFTRDHILAVIEALRATPNKWAKALEMEGGPRVAANRIKYLKDKVGHRAVEFAARPLPNGNHGIFVKVNA